MKSIRARMVSDVASEVQKELGECMPDAAWQAVAALWSTESLTTAFPDTAQTSLTGITCKSCRKGYRCTYLGKKGHLPNADTVTNLTDSEDSEDDFNALDANVQECLNDMAKPGARTAWAGWFPKSFSKLLASFGIPTATAHSLALAIREHITNGMDEMWRERNAAQHQPKERK